MTTQNTTEIFFKIRYLILTTILLFSGCAYLSGTQPNSSNVNYDWFYSSEVESSYDKFDGTTKIQISPIQIYDDDRSVTSMKIFYLYDPKTTPNETFNNAFLSIAKSTYIPTLKNLELKIASNTIIHTVPQHKYNITSQKTGSGYTSEYSSSYHEQTIYSEYAMYKFDTSLLCQFDKSHEMEFKIDKAYKLKNSYSISIEKWCGQIALISTAKNTSYSENNIEDKDSSVAYFCKGHIKVPDISTPDFYRKNAWVDYPNNRVVTISDKFMKSAWTPDGAASITKNNTDEVIALFQLPLQPNVVRKFKFNKSDNSLQITDLTTKPAGVVEHELFNGKCESP